MKIAIVAPFEESVPPEKYGGTELIVSNITEGLVERGHTVYLLSTGDSKTKASIIPIFKEAIRKDPRAKEAKTREAMKYIGIGRVITELKKLDVDIVHNHIGWRLIPFELLIRAPIVTTLHGPMNDSYLQMVYGSFPNHPYVSISKFQSNLFKEINYVGNVYNGIDLDLFGFTEKTNDNLVFLSRMSPEKGAKEAIQIALRAGKPLVMAGKIDATDTSYFEKEIKPFIDGKNIKYIGEIDSKDKYKLLSGALAMIAPIQWHEPFGLFLVEAMACGTPVITTNMGAAPEIVVDGVTGFVVENNIDNFVAAVKKVDNIDRRKCRDRAGYFSKERMVLDYIKVYEKVIGNRHNG